MLSSRGLCVHVLATAEIDELRRRSQSSTWQDDVGRFDIAMDKGRMLSMQVAYSVHNG